MGRRSAKRTSLLATLLGVAAVFAPSLSCSASRSSADARASADDARLERSFEILVWRAGREFAPGLPATRFAALGAERAAALEELCGGDADDCAARLATLLEDPDTPEELWSAAAGACAALELYALSGSLAAALEEPSATQRTIAARAALHRLYGRWFTSAEALEPYRASVTESEGTRLLLESSAWEEARSRDRLLAELLHSPASAGAWLADPDPLVRSGAARILAQVFTHADGDAGAALDLLIAHLEQEHDPLAFHDGLQACLERLTQADPDLAVLTRLRAALLEIAGASADPRTASAAQALADLPWRAQGPRDLAHVLTGIDGLGEMLRGLSEADRERGANDPDPLVATFGALRSLCDVAVAAGLVADLRESRARESTFAILQDAAQDEAVRSMAASTLGALSRPSDGELLAEVLRDPSTAASVKHALLGSVRTLLAGARAGDETADELLAAVAELTGAEDADLRRRALSLCADPSLEALVRRLDPSFLVERLDAEASADSTAVLLRLIQRFGRSDMLGPLLSSERFDRLAADPSRLAELAAALEALVRGSAQGTMSAASRLAETGAEETGLTRLRHALELVAELGDAVAYELYPEEHRAIAAWTWRIYRAGVAPRDAVTKGLAFEQRLLEVHLPRGERAGGPEFDGFGRAESAHLAALLSADLCLSGVGRCTKPQVEADFEAAFALAGEEARAFQVLRDRARFRAAANEAVKAMADYRRLFAAGETGLLAVSDLRTAVALLERLGEPWGEGRTSIGGEASDLLDRIVERPAWRAEPASVRMQDVRNLVRFALDSADRSRLQRVEAQLSDLPLTQVEVAVDEGAGPLWMGLTREPAWFQELLDLRARVRLGLRELEARG